MSKSKGEFQNSKLLEGFSSPPHSIIGLFGSAQLFLYNRYSTTANVDQGTRVTCLFKLQISLHILLPLFAIATLLVETFLIQSGQAYAYQILSVVLKAFVWTYSFALVMLERRRRIIQAMSPTRGHGIILVVTWTLMFAYVNLPFISIWSSDYWWKFKSGNDELRFGLWLTEYILSLATFLLGLKAPALGRTYYQEHSAGRSDSRQDNRTTWKGLWKKLKTIGPMVWPKGKPWLQVCVFLAAALLVAGRVCNLYVPIYYKLIVDDLTKSQSYCWKKILIWVALRFLQGGGVGGMSILTNLRSFIWISVGQHTTKSAQITLFTHLHKLSLRWHLSKKTGEVTRVMARGTTSVTSLLNYIMFQIIPTIADIVIAIIYFISAFDVYFGLIVLGTMALYLVATIIVTEWRTKFRRDGNTLENARSSTAVDSLLNFETVKYYGNVHYEVEKYEKSITELQKMRWKLSSTLNILNCVQNIIITAGLIAGSLLCAWYIHVQGSTWSHHRKFTAGDFVLFSTYILQLYGPLNAFGTYYRMIQANFIDMENMFELLEVDQEVKDVDDAVELEVKHGIIEFRNVHFSYQERKPVLRGISFKVPAGETFALVGSSGAGKSSIIRLLFRFYDIQQGEILIDGYNLTMVKQESLRKAIGIVPQDTVLFNADIKSNIQYGDTSADTDRVEGAAKAADIHDRILSFPDGYETVVGERGLKLSGGEKQRVAIARTILKDPKVILLDEATSALDTRTERNILRAFEEICANRTTLVVAHRLSTIIHANQIIVLDEGQIAEQGTHDELLSANGIYYSMWMEQQKKRDSNVEDSTTAASTSGSASSTEEN